jgi:hypothetical protein
MSQPRHVEEAHELTSARVTLTNSISPSFIPVSAMASLGTFAQQDSTNSYSSKVSVNAGICSTDELTRFVVCHDD